MNKITMDNLRQQKISDLFEMVLADLDRLRGLGISISMSSYWATYDANRPRISSDHTICVVCLGGAAVCGLLPDEQLRSEDVGLASGGYYPFLRYITNNDENKVDALDDMAVMFDFFRNSGLSDRMFENARKVTGERVLSAIQDKIQGDFKVSHIKQLERSFVGYYGSLDNSEVQDLKASIKIAIDTLRQYKL